MESRLNLSAGFTFTAAIGLNFFPGMAIEHHSGACHGHNK